MNHLNKSLLDELFTNFSKLKLNDNNSDIKQNDINQNNIERSNIDENRINQFINKYNDNIKNTYKKSKSKRGP